MGYPVSRVAALAGVTVRTLHHYDDIGLLVPGERTSAGYRVYTEADLERLQQIRFYRELGFGLDEIAVLLDTADPREHFRRQHRLLLERVAALPERRIVLDEISAGCDGLGEDSATNPLTLVSDLLDTSLLLPDPAHPYRYRLAPFVAEVLQRAGRPTPEPGGPTID